MTSAATSTPKGPPQTGTDAKASRAPLTALRALAPLTRPPAPAFARQAQAAVIMNTADMTVHGDSPLPHRATTFSQLLRERDHGPVG
jgi:hypothetical protein